MLDLTTNDLPDGVHGREGRRPARSPDAPAFDGTLTVVISAGSFPVPVRSVDGKVYAQMPLTLRAGRRSSPADYGAPDPAQLISADNGIPAILAATTGLKKGGQVRGGPDNKEVLTTYSGTVPGDAVAHLIPGATGDFDATYGITVRRRAAPGVADRRLLRREAADDLLPHARPTTAPARTSPPRDGPVTP